MNQPNQFMRDALFIKEIIKTLEDTVYIHYPKNYQEILPMLHRAYDSLAHTCYKLEKLNWPVFLAPEPFKI